MIEPRDTRSVVDRLLVGLFLGTAAALCASGVAGLAPWSTGLPAPWPTVSPLDALFAAALVGLWWVHGGTGGARSALAFAAACTWSVAVALAEIGFPAVSLGPVGFLAAALTAAVAPRIASRRDTARALGARALEATGDGLVVLDAKGRILQANDASHELLSALYDGVESAPSEDPAQPALPASLRKLFEDRKNSRWTLGTASQRFFEVWASDEGETPGTGARAMVIRDVTTRRRDETRLLRLAHYDSLTGLPNRRLFLDQLEQGLRRSARLGDTLALLYMDLDRFKEINDTFGHAEGDQLLRTLADRFQRDLLTRLPASPRDGSPACVARLSGDEFAVLLPHAPPKEQIEKIAAGIVQLIGQPIELSQRTVLASGSVGISMFPKDGDDAETLVKHADSALYAAKRNGRNRFEFYQPSFSRAADRNRQIEVALRRALEREELRVHYQPKVDIASERVVGLEALLRWTSPELGTVGPAEFIPIAEDRGLISALGGWCLDETCRQIQAWKSAGFEPVPVSVNVSSAQFAESDVRTVVTEALLAHDLSPELLELELTESLLLQDNDATALSLRDLRSIGIRIALDDFGTGYSALTYLNRFPLDVVKMDRGFLRDIEDNESAAAIVSAVVSMSHSLGLKVVAEGVDSAAQRDLLAAMGCDLIQGFLYAPGLPPDDLERFFARAGSTAPVVEIASPAPGALPSAAPERTPEAVATPRPSVVAKHGPTRPRALLLDDERGTLNDVALRLMRLGVDVHHSSFPDEAILFVTQEASQIHVVIVSPSVSLTGVAEIMEALNKQLEDTEPSLLVMGEEPDAARRDEIRAAGARWALWAPFEDNELRFLVNAAMSLDKAVARRREPRVPMDTTAWVRAGAERRVGVLSSLSAGGAFVEMQDPPEAGSTIRLEFELSSGRITTFATVAYQASEDDGPRALRGIGVVFFDIDSSAVASLRAEIEPRAARYLP